MVLQLQVLSHRQALKKKLKILIKLQKFNVSLPDFDTIVDDDVVVSSLSLSSSSDFSKASSNHNTIFFKKKMLIFKNKITNL